MKKYFCFLFVAFQSSSFCTAQSAAAPFSQQVDAVFGIQSMAFRHTLKKLPGEQLQISSLYTGLNIKGTFENGLGLSVQLGYEHGNSQHRLESGLPFWLFGSRNVSAESPLFGIPRNTAPSIYASTYKIGSIDMQLQYTWLRKGNLSLYSGAGGCLYFGDITSVVAAYDHSTSGWILGIRPSFSPIGFTYGKKYHISGNAAWGARPSAQLGLGITF